MRFLPNRWGEGSKFLAAGSWHRLSQIKKNFRQLDEVILRLVRRLWRFVESFPSRPPPFACWSETEAEAHDIVAAGGHVPVPIRGTKLLAVLLQEPPRATRLAPVRKTDRITHCASGIIAVPVLAPLPNVSVHVLKTPFVRRILADIHGLSGTTTNIRLPKRQAIAKGKMPSSSPHGRHTPIEPPWAIGKPCLSALGPPSFPFQ